MIDEMLLKINLHEGSVKIDIDQQNSHTQNNDLRKLRAKEVKTMKLLNLDGKAKKINTNHGELNIR